MKKPNLSLDSLAPMFDKLEKLAKPQRMLIAALSFIVPVGLFVWLSYMPSLDEIKTLKGDLAKLETELVDAKRRAAELKKYQEEMKKVEERFNLAKRALPESKEIASLLTNIAGSGRDVGLEFLLFEPKPEVSAEFYAEIPVAIQVVGRYFDAMNFFDKISKLTRIINIKDIKIEEFKDSQKKDAKEENKLKFSCMAVTYKFIEPQPEPPPEKKAEKPAEKDKPKK
jgi:type IV pilus assembly protein PilO